MSSWIVIARKEVLVEIITEDCSREDAERVPDAFAREETTIETYKIKVVSVEENK